MAAEKDRIGLIYYFCILFLLVSGVAAKGTKLQSSRRRNFTSNLIPKADDVLDRLYRGLLQNYVSAVSPRTPINVTIGLSLLHVDYDETSQLLETQAWAYYSWTDKRLQWNPDEYDQVKNLHIPSDDVWKPDIKLYNSYGLEVIDTDVRVVVSNTGNVKWIPPVVYNTMCPFETTPYPLLCKLKFGSWVYNGLELNLQQRSPDTEDGLDLSDLMINTKYNLQNATARVTSTYYPCCQEPYIDYTVTLTINKVLPNPLTWFG